MTKRPGSDVADAFLLDCTEKTEWQRILESHYDEAIDAMATKKKNPLLRSLDNFWRNEFANVVQKQGHFTLAELSRVMAWKLARGKFRPLQKLCDSNAPQAVVKASTEAVQALARRDWKGAMAKLTTLKAIGEATASALLAPLAPDLCPFMADEVLEVTYGQRDYTAKAYAIMREKLVAKGEQLGIHAEQVGRVVWVIATLAAHGRPVAYRYQTGGSQQGSERTQGARGSGSMAGCTETSDTRKRPAAGSSKSKSSNNGAGASASTSKSTSAGDAGSSTASNKRARTSKGTTDES